MNTGSQKHAEKSSAICQADVRKRAEAWAIISVRYGRSLTSGAEARIMESGCFTITVMSGAEDGRVFEFDETPVVLGRHPDDSVFLPHSRGVSRHHARITRKGESYFIEDVGSKGKGSANGTYLSSGLRITSRTSISPGDLFLLGTVWLRLDKRDDKCSNSTDD